MVEILKYLQYAAVAQLRGGIGANLAHYKDEQVNFADYIGDGNHINSTRNLHVTADLPTLINMPTVNDNHDIDNSILVYKSIPLKPIQACDERIWVYLSHFELRDYVHRRWPLPTEVSKPKKPPTLDAAQSPKQKKPPTLENVQEKYIHQHYFASGHRGLLRNNAIARLWWMGHIAARSKKFEPRQALEVLLLRADVRANLLERNLGMNPDVFDAVISKLIPDYSKAKKIIESREGSEELNKTLFGRENFRALMIALNRIGGYRMLDSLDFTQLQRMLDSPDFTRLQHEITKILKEKSHLNRELKRLSESLKSPAKRV